MKKSKKGYYKSTIADGDLAKCLDILSDEYRIKEKMFPLKVVLQSQKHELPDDYLEFKDIYKMAEYLLSKQLLIGSDDLIIFRYDDSNILIKRHIRRNA